MKLRHFKFLFLILLLSSCKPEKEIYASIMGQQSYWIAYDPPLILGYNDQAIDLDFDGNGDLWWGLSRHISAGGYNELDVKLIMSEAWEIASENYVDSIYTCEDSVLGTWAYTGRTLYSRHLAISCDRPIHKFQELQTHDVPMLLSSDSPIDTISKWEKSTQILYLDHTPYWYSYLSRIELGYYKEFDGAHFFAFRKKVENGYRYAWCEVSYEPTEDRFRIYAIGYSTK